MSGKQPQPKKNLAPAIAILGLIVFWLGGSVGVSGADLPVHAEHESQKLATKSPYAPRVNAQDLSELDLRAVKIPVFYVTDRAPSEKGELSYTSKRSDHLEYGQIDVNMPIEREDRGQAEEASTQLGWQAESKHADNATVGNPMRMRTSDDFYAALDRARHSTPSGRVLIYVHGYSVDFDKSLRVASRLAYHLELPVVVFSWPSKHNAFKYSADECTAEWSTSDFETLLREMDAHFGNNNLVLVSHSMGSRIITWAIKSIADKAGAKLPALYQHIFFCSPDSDTGTFSRYVPYIEKAAADAKVFVSTRDIRLGVSRFLHGSGRMGRPGSNKKDGAIVSNNVQVIDFSAIDPGIGHSIPYPLLGEIVNHSSLPAGIELKSASGRPGELRMEVIKEAKLRKQQS